MKKMELKRFLAVGLAAGLLSATALSGCGKLTTQDGSGEKDANVDNVEEDNMITIAIMSNSRVTDYEDNYFTNYLEEKTGLEFEFYMLPETADELNTKLSLMTTSQESLPDVLICAGALSSSAVFEYGKNGAFLALDDYISDASKMPNYNAIPEEAKTVMESAQTMADGHTYGLARYTPEIWNRTENRTFINKTWLDKLNLEVPKTTDDLEEVLIAFRDGDPNGNGKQDEIPFYGITNGSYGHNTILTLLNSFVFWAGADSNYGLTLADDGETVTAPFVTDGFKEGLKYLAHLYEENLIDPSVFTDDATQYKAILNEETNVVGLVSSGSPSNWSDWKTNENFFDMVMIAPFEGPEGIAYSPISEYTPDLAFFVFSGTEKVEQAIKLADAFYDETTSIVSRYGVEGEDWSMDSELISEWTNSYVDAGMADSVSLAILNDVWHEENNTLWMESNPAYRPAEISDYVGTALIEDYIHDDPTELDASSYSLYFSKHPDKLLPQLHYTDSEYEQIEEALTNIPAYVEQSIAEFITGTRNVDSDWEDYVKILNDMGLEEMLKISQDAYNRVAG